MKVIYTKLWIGLMLLALTMSGFAETPSCIITHYSTLDGLSHSGVMCMHEDSKGLMWFGTWDGLNKFDGYDFTTFKSHAGDTNSLSHNRVEQIFEDKYGYLWVLTYDEKAHRFNPETENFESFPGNRLSENKEIHVKDIYISQTGNVWLLTKQSGCICIVFNNDGLKKEVLYYNSDANDELKLKSNSVSFVYEDFKQNIWLGTEKGVVLVPKEESLKERFFLDKNNNEKINCITESNGEIWLGTENGELLYFDQSNNQQRKYNLPDQVSITKISKLQNDEIIVGTKGSGFYIFNQNTKIFIHYSANKYKALSDGFINSIYIDNFGVIWLETESAGVVRFFLKTNSLKRFVQKIENVSPYVYYGDYFQIFEDLDNRLWINLKKGGFCYYNRKKDKIEYFYNEPGSVNRKFSNLVTSLHTDRLGNLWLSTHSRGIEKVSFTHEKFRYYKPVKKPTSLSDNDVRSVYEDSNGILWVSTKEGKLFCYRDNELIKSYSGNSENKNDIQYQGMIYSIMEDHEGALWFGTKGNGIVKATYRGNPNNLQFKSEFFIHKPKDSNSISHDWIYSLLEDNYGRVWVGTYGGGVNIIVKDNDKYSILNSKNGKLNYPNTECSQIRHLQIDKNENVWCATTNGLVVINHENLTDSKNTFTLIQRKSGDIESLANNDVHFILPDSKGNMWISTFGGGLGKVITKNALNQPVKFKNYNTTMGLPIDIVLGILEDNDGNLWLSTENGLSKFNTQNETFTNFSEYDGLKSRIFSEASCCKSKDGELHFGSLNGFYSFYPMEIQSEKEKPGLLLTQLQLFNKKVEINDEQEILTRSINLTESIRLNHTQTVFSIEYAGLYFRNPEHLEYAFLMEGFDKEWNFVRGQRKATYTNLPAGDYTFKVKCSLTGKFDNATQKELKVTILPPPWKTRWAYIGYLFIIVALAFVIRNIVLHIMSLKHKVLLEQEVTDIKLRFFTNISHELRTPLSLIIGPIDELLKTDNIQKRTREYLTIIEKNARRMLSHVNNLLDFRKVQTGKMKVKLANIDMISFLREIYNGLINTANIKGIEFNFKTNINELMVWADPEKIDTIIFNLLSNAFKFTEEGGNITLKLEKDFSDIYKISVIDTGVGIKQSEIPFIFDRFKVAENSNDYLSKGSGIGLSLVKDLTELHKGKVDVQSTLNKGTEFIISLNVNKDVFIEDEIIIREFAEVDHTHPYLVDESESIEISEDTNEIKHKNSNTLLVVEDNIELRSYIKSVLSRDYKVYDAANGLEGLKIAQSILPDIIISDIMMPEMDGIELTDKLRNDINTSHIPIILLTAKSSVDNEIEGLKYGADAYIKKPFKMEILILSIKNFLDQRNRFKEKYSEQVDMKVLELAPNEIIVTARDEEFLKNVINTIEENISNNDFSIERIASSVGLGRTTFFKKMKTLTGMAPVEFLKDIKLKRGYQLLESSQFTVSEVAFKIGFSDAGYFTKCFKEKYKTTPTSVKKKIKNDS